MLKIINTFNDKIVVKRIDIIVIRAYNFLKDKLKEPPLGEKNIELIFDETNGPIVYHPIEQDKYKIGLNINGDYPLQIIYQVAHELCHIFIDPRINGLFIEIMCHKTVIDILKIHGLHYCDEDQIENYLKDIKDKCSLKYDVDLSKIDLDWLRKSYREKEFNNIILDREFNNIAAFELKKQTDAYRKFEILKQIRYSIKEEIKFDKDHLSNIISFAKMDFDILALRVGGDLGQIIKIMFK